MATLTPVFRVVAKVFKAGMPRYLQFTLKYFRIKIKLDV